VVVVRELSESAEGVFRTLSKVEDSSGAVAEFIGIFRSTDWARELACVSGLFERHNCKITITHGDTFI
jgi:hypothetical protein